jgi:intracellular septation protein
MVHRQPGCAFALTLPRSRWTETNLTANAMKLLFDLFPVLLFFVFFKFGNTHPETATALLTSLDIVLGEGIKPAIFLATLVAMIATTTQIIWTKLRHGKVDMMLWITFAIVGVFGGATLLLHDETFIKWKPTVLYWMFSVILLLSNLLFKKNLMRALLHEKIALPVHAWNRINLSWSLFFAMLGFINLYVAFNYSTDTWVDFKLFGFTGLIALFILAQGAWLSKYIDEKKENN